MVFNKFVLRHVWRRVCVSIAKAFLEKHKGIIIRLLIVVDRAEGGTRMRLRLEVAEFTDTDTTFKREGLRT